MKSNSKSSQSRSAMSSGNCRTSSSSCGNSRSSGSSSSKLDPTGMYKRPQQQQVKCHYLDPTGLY